jgi:hypothetical protein
MKTTILKIAAIFLLSFTLAQNSDAYGCFYHRAPVVYCGPRYERVFIPGHFFINRFGVREWVRPCYR